MIIKLNCSVDMTCPGKKIPLEPSRTKQWVTIFYLEDNRPMHHSPVWSLGSLRRLPGAAALCLPACQLSTMGASRRPNPPSYHCAGGYPEPKLLGVVVTTLSVKIARNAPKLETTISHETTNSHNNSFVVQSTTGKCFVQAL